MFGDLMHHANEESRLRTMFLEKIEGIFGTMNFMDASYDELENWIDVTLGKDVQPTEEQLGMIWTLGVTRMFVKVYGMRNQTYYYVGGPKKGKLIDG